MKLFLKNHTYKYALEQILLMMFPSQRPEYPEIPVSGDRCESTLSESNLYATASCRLFLDGSVFSAQARVLRAELTDDLKRDRLLQKIIKQSFYRASLKSGCIKPVWGSLTGIRPGKLFSGLLESGMSPRSAVSKFCRTYDVSPERANLCLATAKAGLHQKNLLHSGDICLYIGIPFCPTRCAYCSFVSQSVERSMGLIPPFLDALFAEIEATAKTVNRLSMRPISLYFGGGTPTTLTAKQLDLLCQKLESCFDLSSVREFTVEAGRPDTITMEKLDILNSHGTTRISVNPQSMENHVLDAIGRGHTSEDIVSALEIVRASGTMDVNMDLIAGLPSDTPAGFSRTLDAVLALKPENITVHTLSLKKGTRITLGESHSSIPSAADVGIMLDEAQERLSSSGYLPYYLYRQKFMSGGFENIGWCMPGHDNEYNICIMEELCGIISMGGGASTKLVSPGGRIERVFAPKYPKEYIENIDKTIAEKSKIEVFYSAI